MKNPPKKSYLDERVNGWTCPCGCDAQITMRQAGIESFIAAFAGDGSGPRVNLTSSTPARTLASAIHDETDMTTCRCAKCVRTFSVPTWALEQVEEHGNKLQCAVCRAKGRAA